MSLKKSTANCYGTHESRGTMHSNPLVFIHVFWTLHGICYSFTRTHESQSKPPTGLTSPLLICAMNLLTFLSYGQHENHRGWTSKWGRQDRDLQKTEKNKSKLQRDTPKGKSFGRTLPTLQIGGPQTTSLEDPFGGWNTSVKDAPHAQRACTPCCNRRVMKKHNPENYITMMSGSSKPLKRAESLLHL